MSQNSERKGHHSPELLTDEQADRLVELEDKLAQLPLDEALKEIENLAKGEDPYVISALRRLVPIPDLSNLRQGTRIADRYAITEKIGDGGMGVVYAATQDITMREAALKIIRPQLVFDSKLANRFHDEARILVNLSHPGIVTVFEAGVHKLTENGPRVCFIAMERIEGEPVTEFVRNRQPSMHALLLLVLRIADAVRHVHDRKVVHRDLKPGNILVSRDGNPVILDFGIAELMDSNQLGMPAVGTLPYMSPEQFADASIPVKLGQSVDVYALGVLTFELITGKLPHNDENGDRMLASDSDEERRRIRNPRQLTEHTSSADKRLEHILNNALAPDPADRYFSVSSFSRAITNYVATRWPDDANLSRSDTWSRRSGARVPNTSWTLLRRIGEGRSGEVWLARHDDLDLLRVIKFCDTPDAVRSLKRERSLFKILKEEAGEHPGFVELHDASLDEPPYYLMMDYVEGGDLGSWVLDRDPGVRFEKELGVGIVARVAETAHFAHRAGVLHRDIKPSNILVGDSTSGDFPIAIYLADLGTGQIVADQLKVEIGTPGFTRTVLGREKNPVSGTYLYMAPQIFAGEPASVQTDIHSLGVLLFQWLVGDFSQPLTYDWARHVPDPELREDLSRCFAQDSEVQFETALDLAEQLRSLPQRRQARKQEEEAEALRLKAAFRRKIALVAGIASLIIVALSAVSSYALRSRAEAEESAKHAQRSTTRSVLGEIKLTQGSQTSGGKARALRLINETKETIDELPKEKSAFRNAAATILALTDFTQVEGSTPPPNGTTAVAVSPTGKFIAYGINDGIIRITDVASGQPTLAREFRLREGEVTRAIAMSSDSRHLATVSVSGRASLWNWRTGKEIRQLAVDCRAVTFSANGTLIACGNSDGTIKVFRLPDLDEQFTLSSGHKDSNSDYTPPSRPARALAFDEVENRLAAASDDSHHVLVWDLQTRKLTDFLYHPNPVADIAWHPSKSILAAACKDGNLYLWLIHVGRTADPALLPHDRPLVKLYGPSLAGIASATGDQLSNERELINSKVSVTGVQFNSSGTNLAVADASGSIGLIDLRKIEYVSILQGFGGELSLFGHSDRNDLTTISEDSRIATWEISESNCFWEVDFDDRLGSFQFASSHGLLMTVTSSDIRFFSLENLEEILPRLPVAFPREVAWVPASSSFYVIGREGLNRREVTVADNVVSLLPGIEITTKMGVIETDNAAKILAVSEGGTIRIYDQPPKEGDEPIGWEAPGIVDSLRIASDRRWIAAGMATSESIVIWPLEKSSPPDSPPIRIEATDVQFAIHPSGKWLVSRIPGIYEIRKAGDWSSTPRTLAVDGHSGAAVFNPSGDLLAVVADDSEIGIHRFPSLERVIRLKAPQPRRILDIAFDGTGTRIAAMTDANRIQLWDLATLEKELSARELGTGTLPSHRPKAKTIRKIEFIDASRD